MYDLDAQQQAGVDVLLATGEYWAPAGSGKTRVALAAMARRPVSPTLVFAPDNALCQWRDEYRDNGTVVVFNKHTNSALRHLLAEHECSGTPLLVIAPHRMQHLRLYSWRRIVCDCPPGAVAVSPQRWLLHRSSGPVAPPTSVEYHRRPGAMLPRDCTIARVCQAGAAVSPAVAQYRSRAVAAALEAGDFDCPICYTTRPSAVAYSLPCGHLFCPDCASDIVCAPCPVCRMPTLRAMPLSGATETLQVLLAELAGVAPRAAIVFVVRRSLEVALLARVLDNQAVAVQGDAVRRHALQRGDLPDKMRIVALDDACNSMDLSHTVALVAYNMRELPARRDLFAAINRRTRPPDLGLAVYYYY